MAIPLNGSLSETKVFLKTLVNGFAQNHLNTVLKPFYMVFYNTPAKEFSNKPLYGSEKRCRCKTIFEPFTEPFVLTVYSLPKKVDYGLYTLGSITFSFMDHLFLTQRGRGCS